ncbi:squalene cyclase, partial [Kineococcus sp. R8]|nr:squalene cyclase [Kineococcus siccus]
MLAWLLDTDPALRWQVERDLAGAPEEEWRVTRARVATEGFGARLLAHQDPDGRWAGGAYFPAHP